MDIIKILQEELGIRRGQVETTIKLIDEGNTIPFIARYRKEMTGSLDDETLRNFHERLLYLRNLEERKEAIKKNIEEQFEINNYFLSLGLRSILFCCFYKTLIYLHYDQCSNNI